MLRGLVLFILVELIRGDQCPSGGLFNAQFNKCYIFTSEPAPFALAEQDCINIGGHLVSISNAYENDIISDNAKSALSSTNATDFWIGASDLVTTGKWAWTDNANFLFTNWASGQPQSGKDCATSHFSDGRWLASGCLVDKAYACAVPPQLASTCPPPPTCPTLTTPTPAVCTQRKCAAHCDSEWTYFVQANSCYKLFFGQKWDDAEAFCIEQGGHLTSVHSEQENTFVANLARTNQKQSNPHDLTWIGMKANGNAWEWTDKSKVDYINWAPKQPDNPGKENCVQIAQDPSDHGWYENWNNEDCNTVMRAFVCKKSSIA